MMMMQERRMGDITGSGYFIRRAGPIHDRAVMRNPRSVIANNRENIDPLTGRVNGSTRQRRSPLPDWYPRQPLRDITALIQAIDARAERRRQEEQVTASLIQPSPIIPEQQTATPLTNQIASNNNNNPPLIAMTPEEEAIAKKLSESIKKIEKLVKKNNMNLKRKKGGEREARVKVLMSLR